MKLIGSAMDSNQKLHFINANDFNNVDRACSLSRNAHGCFRMS